MLIYLWLSLPPSNFNPGHSIMHPQKIWRSSEHLHICYLTHSFNIMMTTMLFMKTLLNEEANRPLKKLKSLMCSYPVLSSPDFNKLFVVQTDVPEQEVGKVLAKVENGGEEHPICYYSRILIPWEKRYSVIETDPKILSCTEQVTTIKMWMLCHRHQCSLLQA